MKKVIDGIHRIGLGGVNAYLLEAGRELVLVDTGWPGKHEAVLAAVRKLGRSAGDLRHLVLTHSHPDHIGAAAAIVRATGATTYMHGDDVALAESGGPFRPMRPAKGFLQRVLFALLWRPQQRVEPVRIDHRLADGDVLPFAGAWQVIHVPGHCAGQIALLRQDGAALIAADACTNLIRLGDPLGFEDVATGRRSQRALAERRFGVAMFGHGKSIKRNTAARFGRAYLRAGRR